MVIEFKNEKDIWKNIDEENKLKAATLSIEFDNLEIKIKEYQRNEILLMSNVNDGKKEIAGYKRSYFIDLFIYLLFSFPFIFSSGHLFYFLSYCCFFLFQRLHYIIF